jgi:transglutaminase-like putative cysteine protease
MRLIWLLLGCLPFWAQAQQYPAFSVRPELKRDAGAVIRLREEEFEITAVGEAVERVREVVTIFDERGLDYASKEVFYNKNARIRSFEGRLLDASGKEQKRLKKSDIVDASAHASYSLYDDSKVRQATFRYAVYPFTVEFAYELVSKSTAFYPYWFPQQDEEAAVEQSSLTVRVPASLGVRYRELNGAKLLRKTEEAGILTQTWEVRNLSPREKEPYTDPYAVCGPAVLVAPNAFQMEGYKGSAASWKEIGQFFYDLNAGRDELPETTKQAVLQLVRDDKDTRAKIARLYRHLQQSTRYVSIQVGIGGWQTFPASTVAEKGYGDCKALSNYLKGMLKVAGIQSFTASITAGKSRPDILPDFPSVVFNHEVLCVPLEKDTVWLECTDQYGQPGYMGSFTGGRYALLETPAGGKLVRTPDYQEQQNGVFRRVNVRLDAKGSARVDMATRYTGIQQETLREVKETTSGEDLRKWMLQQIHLASFDLVRFQLSDASVPAGPVMTEELTLDMRQAGTLTDHRLFVPLAQFSRKMPVPDATVPREHDLIWKRGFTDADTVTCRVPEGYQLEGLPEPVEIKTQFGTYRAKTMTTTEGLTYIRTLQVLPVRRPASDYAAWIDFWKKVAKADRVQAVWKEK